MIRKILLLLLMVTGVQQLAHAQYVDTVAIAIPYGADTTCPGIQIDFSASHTNPADTVVGYHWYTDNFYTGVSIDSFHTTALVDGDSVYCILVFRNGLGGLDSVQSNTIIIHRSGSIAPRVAITLITGSNPGCPGQMLTFRALPVNGGDSTLYQWYDNGSMLAGRDSISVTDTFNSGDTVTCEMISNSACAAPFPDTVFSPGIVVLHSLLTAAVSITTTHNPICAGALDSFVAVTANTGVGATISWYVDSVLIPSALGTVYINSTLHNGDIVYCELNAPDRCIVNHSTTSNEIDMTVITLQTHNTAWTILTEGNNPGCLDSPVTFTGHFQNFGVTTPLYTWYINGIAVLSGDSVYTHFYNNHDVLSYRVVATDDGCYANDTAWSPAVVMIRDSTPPMPWLSLEGDLLVVNNGGSYIWYQDSTLIPGAISHTFHPTSLGYYYVVKDTANCPSLPSNVIYISLTGVKNVQTGAFKIYPNPTTGLLNMDWGAVQQQIEIAVFDMEGQLVAHEVVTGQSSHQSDLSSLPAGSYLVTLTDKDHNQGSFKITLTR